MYSRRRPDRMPAWLALFLQQRGGGPSETGGRRFAFTDRGRRGSTGRPSQFQSEPSRDLPRRVSPKRGSPMQSRSYRTNGGILIRREISNRDYRPADKALAEALDIRRGVLFSSSFEFPGRYTRWDMGFVDPPVAFAARGRRFSDRGAEPTRPHPAEPHRGGDRRACGDHGDTNRRRPNLGGNPRERAALSRREQEPAALGVLGAARD